MLQRSLAPLIAFLGLLLCGLGCGQDLEKEEQLPPRKHLEGPDHLVPVESQEYRVAYEAKLKEVFGLEEFAFARVISGGWAEIDVGEWVISLHGREGDVDLAKTEKIFITIKTANQNVWYTLPESRDPRLPQQTLVSVTTVPLEKALALRLIKLWERMLERTAPKDREKHPYTTNDGSSYEFSVSGKRGRYLSMPDDRGSTGIFCGLTLILHHYASISWVGRRPLIKEIEEQATKLEKYLDQHPGK